MQQHLSQVELDDIAWKMNIRARARVWAGSVRLNCSCQNCSMFASIIMVRQHHHEIVAFGDVLLAQRASVALRP
ncbi:MAG: hypothetical protein VB125_00025 [Burkholderia sp.]